MTWEFFYDNYLSWADSTIASRLSQISDLQNADPADIVECCLCIDDKFATRLLRKAGAAGVSFTISQSIELWPYIDDEAKMSEIVKTAIGSCFQKELEELNGCIEDKTISAVDEKFGLHDPNENAIWKPGVFAFLGVMGNMKGSSKAHGFQVGDHVRVKYRGQEGTV